jgi:hypothetical protein
VYGADREHRRADVVEDVPGADDLVVGDQVAKRLDDGGELVERAAEGGKVGMAKGGPQADAVSPRRGAAAKDARDSPAFGANLAEDPLHVAEVGTVRLAVA